MAKKIQYLVAVRFIMILLSLSSVVSAQKFSLNMELSDAPNDGKIYLYHKYNEEIYCDSLVIKKNKVEFTGKTPEPNMYWISKAKNVNPELIFFIDYGVTKIKGKFDSLGKAKVDGGSTQQHYLKYNSLVSQYNSERDKLLQQFQECRMKGDQPCQQKIFESAQLLEKTYISDLVALIKKNPDSNVGGYLIFISKFDWATIPDYDALHSALGEKVKKGKFGKLALDKINSIKGTTIGYTALDFTQADQNGIPISLSSFKGKYLLVDFWASWCGPCRMENPNVVAAYNKYKSKGFEIFGVSFDDNKDKWLNAVKKDGLEWPQVSDLKGWQNEAGKLYGVTSIPFNLLLDKEGKILAKGLRGPALEEELKKIFGE